VVTNAIRLKMRLGFDAVRLPFGCDSTVVRRRIVVVTNA